MDAVVLVINPGSSSHKYALYRGEERLAEAYYEATPSGHVLTLTLAGETTTADIAKPVFTGALADFLKRLADSGLASAKQIEAVGLRVVAPGRYFLDHHWFDDATQAQLAASHHAAALHAESLEREVKQLKHLLPERPLAAISDSAFHKTISHEARNYAINPGDADQYDLYRFGYHGLSVSSVVEQLAKRPAGLPERLLVCHLGSGASLTAVRGGQSLDTSMGYSPLEGLVMATRSGNLDVMAALELKRRQHWSDAELEDYLNYQAGLQGLAGDGDIRALLDHESAGDQSATLALDLMAYRLRFYIGAYLAILGGLDALVFTATVGVRSAPTRARVLIGLEHLGIKLDSARNEEGSAQLQTDDAGIEILLQPSDENLAIARATQTLLAAGSS